MSENRDIFRETADRLFADQVDTKLIEAAERRELPVALFDALAETGITIMLAAEEAGGIGADLGDALAILRAAGKAAAPGPILETILANHLLALGGEDLATGPATVAFASTGQTTIENVAWPEVALAILVVQPDGVFLSTPGDWEIVPGRDPAGEPRDTIRSTAPGRRIAADAGVALRHAALLRAGQMLGAIDWALERSVDYAGERKQFGREIGKFQAIQQMLSEMADHALASAAITLAAGDADTPTLVAAARSRLADAVDSVVSISHQVHGAIGFSREYPLNYRTRRLMAWRDDYGTAGHWRRVLAGQFTGLSLEAFWPAVADAGASRVA